ncbi:MAG: hypothetical protein HFJ80_02900 [Clostridiales bacterium]|nr:hypothetical protein [Clostridiales bacterium]
MNISRLAKGIVYLLTAAVLILTAALLQSGMHNPSGPEEAYFRTVSYLFILAAVLLGTGVYSFFSYTRRKQQHRLDSLFLVITGGVIMLSAVLLLVNYGGLEVPFDEAGYQAANVTIFLTAALPLPFLARACVLAFSADAHRGTARLILRCACGALAAVLILLIAVGPLLRMVRYSEPAPLNPFIDEI